MGVNMRITVDLTQVKFTEFLIVLAESDFLGNRCKEAILDIPRSELIKKSDHLYSILDNHTLTATLDDIKEIINYSNWGAPDYKEDGSEFWE